MLGLVGLFATIGVTAVNAEPLRKCSFYEIMNDEDEDGLVQDPKDGPSVCQYTQKDLAIAKKNPVEQPVSDKARAVTTIPKVETVKPRLESKSTLSKPN
jgi:hypothetical protein